MLAQKYLRTVTIREPLPVQGNAFKPGGFAAQVNVQPMSGSAANQMYGLKPSQMRMLFAGLEVDLCEGQGVCVEVGAGQDPDFRVIYLAKWTRHQVAHLRLIPEDERGADE